MDGVDLDVAQARADLLPDKYDRRRISQALAIRRLSSWHYKRPMSEGSVCSGWMLLLLLVCSLHHIYSKYWQLFKRRHALLVCFVSLPLALCWKAGKKLWKEFMESDAVCDGAMMLGLYWEVILELWLFLKRHWLTTEIHIVYVEPDEGRPTGVVESKVNKEPVVRVKYEMVLCYGTGWAWFRSLMIGPSHLVIRQLLIISGDVELNPGPLDHGELNDTSYGGLCLVIHCMSNLQKLNRFFLKLMMPVLVCVADWILGKCFHKLPSYRGEALECADY